MVALKYGVENLNDNSLLQDHNRISFVLQDPPGACDAVGEHFDVEEGDCDGWLGHDLGTLGQNESISLNAHSEHKIKKDFLGGNFDA